MEIKHVQAELAAREYKEFRGAARGEGLSLKQAAHEAVVQWSRQKTGKRDPLWDLVGAFKAGRPDASETVDEIYKAD